MIIFVENKISYLLALISSDGKKLGFLENHGSESAPRDLVDVITLYNVYSGLISVHRVEDRLKQ